MVAFFFFCVKSNELELFCFLNVQSISVENVHSSATNATFECRPCVLHPLLSIETAPAGGTGRGVGWFGSPTKLFYGFSIESQLKCREWAQEEKKLKTQLFMCQNKLHRDFSSRGVKKGRGFEWEGTDFSLECSPKTFLFVQISVQ